MTALDVLARADSLTYDEVGDQYVIDGSPVDADVVIALLGSGRLARVPWENRYRAAKENEAP